MLFRSNITFPIDIDKAVEIARDLFQKNRLTESDMKYLQDFYDMYENARNEFEARDYLWAMATKLNTIISAKNNSANT